MNAVIDATPARRAGGPVPDDVGIPPCPAILTRLVREMRSDEPDFRRVAQLVGADAGVASTMLRAVNSPLFGQAGKAGKAGSVQHAVAMLGLKRVTQIVTGELLAQSFATSQSRLMQKFWRDSVRIAFVAAHLAVRTRAADRDDAHTFALFRDCGIAVMLAHFPGYEPLLAAAGSTLLELEAARFGTTHVDVGARLARKWLLPDAFCDGIAHHHRSDLWQRTLAAAPDPAHVLAALALVAEYLCAGASRTAPPLEWQEAAPSALGMIGVDADALPALVGEAAGWLSGA